MQADDLCVLADVKQWLGLGTLAESYAIPASSPYTLTVAKSVAFISDLGVVSLTTGAPMTKTTGALSSGKYSVAQGVYTFFSGDAGSNVGITYLTFGVDDVLLGRLITAVSEFIRSYTQLKFDVESYTEYRSGVGWGQSMLVLKNSPIVTVTSLTIDDVVIPALPSNIPDVNGVGFAYTPTHVSLYGYEFTKGLDNIVVVYSAGYSSVPYDLAQAAIELACFKFREKDRIGHKSKSLGGEVVAFITDEMPESVKSALNKYRRVIPVV
jgi:hypothetical protein